MALLHMWLQLKNKTKYGVVVYFCILVVRYNLQFMKIWTVKSNGDESELDWWYEQQGIKTFILESGKTIKISETLNKGYIEWKKGRGH